VEPVLLTTFVAVPVEVSLVVCAAGADDADDAWALQGGKVGGLQ